MQQMEFFRTFRFSIELPEKGEFLGVMSAYGDPFTKGFWVGRGHQVGAPTLAQYFAETTKLNAYMYARAHASDTVPLVRVINVRYDSFDWSPIGLDATESGIALDWVCLRNVEYVGTKDLVRSEIPTQIAANFDSRHKQS